MSVRPTEITAEIYDYILANFSAQEKFLENLKQETIALDMPQISISSDQARFLQFLIKASGIKRILEIGSLGGYSALAMAFALPETGKITAVEINPDYAAFIKRMAQQSGLSDKVEVINDDGKHFIKNLSKESKFDFVFVDADKTAYKYYFDRSMEILSLGGIFAIDNALAFGEIVNNDVIRNKAEVQAIREFNNYIANNKNISSSLLTIGDGLLLCRKNGN